MKANGRTGELNFVSCLRQTLEKHYGEKPVGMGGTFIIQKGKAKIHVMVCCSQSNFLCPPENRIINLCVDLSSFTLFCISKCIHKLLG